MALRASQLGKNGNLKQQCSTEPAGALGRKAPKNKQTSSRCVLCKNSWAILWYVLLTLLMLGLYIGLWGLGHSPSCALWMVGHAWGLRQKVKKAASFPLISTQHTPLGRSPSQAPLNWVRVLQGHSGAVPQLSSISEGLVQRNNCPSELVSHGPVRVFFLLLRLMPPKVCHQRQRHHCHFWAHLKDWLFVCKSAIPLERDMRWGLAGKDTEQGLFWNFQQEVQAGSTLLLLLLIQ